jgi:hypothetical protein
MRMIAVHLSSQPCHWNMHRFSSDSTVEIHQDDRYGRIQVKGMGWSLEYFEVDFQSTGQR